MVLQQLLPSIAARIPWRTVSMCTSHGHERGVWPPQGDGRCDIRAFSKYSKHMSQDCNSPFMGELKDCIHSRGFPAGARKQMQPLVDMCNGMSPPWLSHLAHH